MWVIEKDFPGDFQIHSAHCSLPIFCMGNGSELLISDGVDSIDSIPLRGTAVTGTSWHQQLKNLLIAWGNGVISIWLGSDSSIRDGKAHAARVTHMMWIGMKFVTADEDNHVVVWKVDGRGRVGILTEYRLAHPICRCLKGSEM